MRNMFTRFVGSKTFENSKEIFKKLLFFPLKLNISHLYLYSLFFFLNRSMILFCFFFVNAGLAVNEFCQKPKKSLADNEFFLNVETNEVILSR